VVVVPVYDHGTAFAAMAAALGRQGLPVIAVDDGSGAATRAILDGLAADHCWLRVVRHATNLGKGAAVATGFRCAVRAGYSHALQIDADGQHETADLPAFVECARRDPAALVLGVPEFDATMPRIRRFGRYLTHIWVWIETLSFDIPDSMCGYRVYPLAAVLPLLEARQLGRRMVFDSEILVRLHWQGVRFAPLPTRVTYPRGNHSNFRLWRDNVLISAMHTRLVFGMLWRLPELLRHRRHRRLPTP
jgi:glycosyltransferase involved in cell wall biosynthesis